MDLRQLGSFVKAHTYDRVPPYIKSRVDMSHTQHQKKKLIARISRLKGQLEAVKVRLAVRSGDAGRLFGSVTPADIASAIKASGGPEVDKRRIELTSPIKTLGAHETSVRLHPEVAAKVNIEVVAA